MVRKFLCYRPAAMVLLLSATACSGPSYYRRVGEAGEKQPCESLSFEPLDYGYLARLFADELKQHPLYQTLRGDPGGESAPCIAHLEFKTDKTDRNTKASIMEKKILSELMRDGVRYISEQERKGMIEAIKRQHSDLNDQETRAEFGKFANAKYYLAGEITDVLHAVSLTKKKRDFHLFIKLLQLETLETRFSCDVVVTKYMEK